MYLAAILGLCALISSSATAVVSPPQLLALMQESQPPDAAPAGSPQEPSQNTPPARPEQETPQPSQETGTEKTGNNKTGGQPPQPQGTPAPEMEQPAQKARPNAGEKAPDAAAKTAARKRRPRKHTAATSNSARGKKVVRNGGTADPVVQLSPGVSDEQASRQRQSTTQLLATTDANLKQLAARQLNATQQDSVSQ